MKKILILIGLLLTITVGVIDAQLLTDSWTVGAGFRYPRFVSSNVTPLNSNYGLYLTLQRNFTEHVGLRLKTGFSHLEDQYLNPNSNESISSTNLISGDLDLIYYLIPCETISPYLFGGLGGYYRMLNNQYTTSLDNNKFGAELNTGVGFEVNLTDVLKLSAEFGYHVTMNSELDGADLNTEASGKDSYMGINLGVSYYLSKGEHSKYCQMYSGITQEFKDMTNYSKIEEMIVKHIPKEVTKEVVVEKPAGGSFPDHWVLVGVNFAFNSAELTPESYPILYDAAKTLLRNPDLNIEIQGHTDNIGSASYNMKLSQKRADAVKYYLMTKMVPAGRLTAVGYGESNPAVDNKTAQGRATNRRIEFKVK